MLLWRKDLRTPVICLATAVSLPGCTVELALPGILALRSPPAQAVIAAAARRTPSKPLGRDRQENRDAAEEMPVVEHDACWQCAVSPVYPVVQVCMRQVKRLGQQSETVPDYTHTSKLIVVAQQRTAAVVRAEARPDQPGMVCTEAVRTVALPGHWRMGVAKQVHP